MTTDTTDKRIIRSDFTPARWLKHRHLQTMFPSLPWAWRQRPTLRREVLRLPDGDATAVDWLDEADQLPQSAPLLVILHGLEGSAESSYARMLMQAAFDRHWRPCVLHFRDCGDYRNLLPRRYHAGETSDIRYFLQRLQDQGHVGPKLAVGYSLGGNILLKYLGESGRNSRLDAAGAVCVPLDLYKCAEALNKGFSKVYQRHLLNNMKKSVRRKFDRHTAAFDWERAMKAETFAEFDDAVTAPLHGFMNMADYYDKCSSARFLRHIARPTLIVNSLDDPFMTPGVIPHRDQLSDNVLLEIADAGGHVGFIEGGTPWRPRYYLPRRMLGFLEEQL
ncbi:MAG: hydrolase [Gammaproteobacteria bacterium]|nr:hydrolase [Gammaproteobacteria bacterium]MDH3373397.1 hydrolase [Gammaproteobacteria bacterium]MDH3408198.1 hydrolase [Gammaproteobacteria bacterium]MDH3552227.1 hydrolase [Gammaproteobacteria bacterium]